MRRSRRREKEVKKTIEGMRGAEPNKRLRNEKEPHEGVRREKEPLRE